MGDPVQSVRKIETEVERELGPKLADWIALSERLERAKWDLLADPVPRTGPQHITQLICARLQNDLRSVVVLTQRGYVLQALSLAAGMLELGFTVGWIGTREDHAAKWQTWTDDRHVPTDNVWNAIQETFRNGEQPAAVIQPEFDHYIQLCKAKHGNPQIFRTFGIALTNEQLMVYHGPYFSMDILHAARLAMWYAVRYTLLGLTCYNDFHVPVGQRSVRAIELGECRGEMVRILNLNMAEQDKERDR